MSDLISRQDAIDAIQAHKHNVLDAREYDEGVACGYAAAHNHICDVIAILPSAQPKRKTGHWINGYKRQTCFICKQRGYRSWNFCPNCGADMRGEQDG